MYQYGEGVPKDIVKAVYWLEKAAKQGDAMAQSDLGALYLKGADIAQDYQKALYWCNLAAKQGEELAQCNLGYMYHHGLGIPADRQRAIYFYSLAAEQGLARAKQNLGYLYGQDGNYSVAIPLLLEAARQGQVRAQYNLGAAYLNGQGVAQDLAQSLYWFEQAARQGDSDAKEKVALVQMLQNTNA